MVSLELEKWEVRKVAVVAGKLVVDVASGAISGRLTIESLVNGHEPGDFGSAAEGLVGAGILHADADDFGSLKVEFEHGITIQVAAVRDREAWNFFSSTAFGVVCAPGGSVAVFRSEQEWEKLRAQHPTPTLDLETSPRPGPPQMAAACGPASDTCRSRVRAQLEFDHGNRE